MLEVDELSVSYGAIAALRSVCLRAPAGEITSVLGANGAGKTTLLRTISGLVKPPRGPFDSKARNCSAARSRWWPAAVWPTSPRAVVSSKG